MKEPTPWLVCAPADAPAVVPGSVFGNRCVKCGVEVMIAPSGQAVLKRHPDFLIACGACFNKYRRPDCQMMLAAPPRQMRRESRDAFINPRRRRNN